MLVDEKGYVATVTMLDEVTLTNDFNGNFSEATRLSPLAQVELLLDYSMGEAETGNICTVRVQLSEGPEGPWRELSIGGDAAPANGVVETTLYNRRFLIAGEGGITPTSRWFAFPSSAKYLRISALESGVAANAGTLTAKLRLSNGLRTD